MAKRNKKSNVLMLTVMGMLVAVTLLFGLTPVGYIKAGVIEITILQLPVIVGAVLYGWKAGTLLGAVFGITSFIQCFGMSAFGAALLEINPFLTAVTCIVPRTLMGFLVGIIFTVLSKFDKKKFWSFLAASLSAALLNTLLFMACFLLCFWNTEYIQSLAGGSNIMAFSVAFVGVNGVVEALVCAILGTAIAKTIYTVDKRMNAQVK